MIRLDFIKAALLAGAALLAAQPSYAQDQGNRGRAERAERAERRGPAPGELRQAPRERGEWGGGRAMREGGGTVRARREVNDAPAERQVLRQAPSEQAAVRASRNYGGDRSGTYTAPRERSYGADARARNWRGQQQQAQGTVDRPRPGSWAAPRDRSYGATLRGDNRQANAAQQRDWRQDRREDWRQDRRQDRRDDWRQDRRDERRDDARNYTRGYRDGVRADNRYGRDHRSWDRNHWRNDRRYDWYRYRAANRSIFSLGRYYAPYRNYSYSRISIGFRLGSPFYSNRYWINDPWRYRLPDVYGPYRWVRYYDDALLVDVYSGEVVDVIHDFFW